MRFAHASPKGSKRGRAVPLPPKPGMVALVVHDTEPEVRSFVVPPRPEEDDDAAADDAAGVKALADDGAEARLAKQEAAEEAFFASLQANISGAAASRAASSRPAGATTAAPRGRACVPTAGRGRRRCLTRRAPRFSPRYAPPPPAPGTLDVEESHERGTIREGTSSAPWGEQLDYKGPTTLAGYAAFTDGTSARDDNEPRPKSDKCGTARRYRVGPRADMRTVIKPILKELGLCEVDEPQADHLEQAQMNWEAPWVKPKKFFRPKLLRPGVIINSVGGMAAQIGEKPSLARLHERCFGRFGIDIMAALPPSLPHCRFTMRGFNDVRQGSELSMRLKGFRQYAASLDAAEPEPHRIWILKPLGGFNQVGIHMYSMDKSKTESEVATKEWVLKHVPEGQWVLQEYVMNPMTFQGHKFDLRIWAICTSLDTRVYLMGSIPKVASGSTSRISRRSRICASTCSSPAPPVLLCRDPLVRIIDPYPKSTTDMLVQ